MMLLDHVLNIVSVISYTFTRIQKVDSLCSISKKVSIDQRGEIMLHIEIEDYIRENIGVRKTAMKEEEDQDIIIMVVIMMKSAAEIVTITRRL